ncbi:MAG TPA: SPOR domain-containing protein, partial [Caulobacteraceae bacterium]|nr:SPOR domain-containing protein [Caulobacteraceae bacterium]
VPGGSAVVQAAAFADRANAERAAARLSAAGEASIEPLDRDSGRLWRVVVRSQGGAEDLRQRVVAAGFEGARVLGGY